MIGRRAEKVPGGKLMKLEADIEDGIVVRLSIRGDFFAHPEEGFDRVEAALCDVPLVDLEAAMVKALSREGVTLYGISPADVAAAVGRIAHDLTTA